MEVRSTTIDPALLQLAWGRDDELEPELLAPRGPVRLKVDRHGEEVPVLFDSAREALKFFMAERLRDLGVPHAQIRISLLRLASGLEAIAFGDAPSDENAELLLWTGAPTGGEPRTIAVPWHLLELIVIGIARQVRLGGTDPQVLRWASRCMAEAAHEFEDMPDPDAPSVRGEIVGRLLVKSPREGLEAFVIEMDDGGHRVYCEPRPPLIPELRSLGGQRVVVEGEILRGPASGQPVVAYVHHVRPEAERVPREIVRPKPVISTTGHASGGNARASFDWLRKHSAEYAGRWVALHDGDVADSDESLRQLRERISGRPDYDELRLLQVPHAATA